MDDTAERPTLRAIILDCSAVNNVDATSVQALIDVRNQLDRYAQPDTVEWHFANVRNAWTRRALVAAGFGFLQPKGDAEAGHRWKSIFSVADLAEAASPLSGESHLGEKGAVEKRTSHGDEEIGVQPSSITEDESSARQVPVYGLNRPFFHADVQEAFDAVLENIEYRPHVFKA